MFSNASSDIHELVVLANQVVKAQERVSKKVVLPLIDAESVRAIKLLRNVHEHWESVHGIDFGAPPTNLSRVSKGAREFILAYPGKNPNSVLLPASGPVIGGVLDVNNFWRQLEELEKALVSGQSSAGSQ